MVFFMETSQALDGNNHYQQHSLTWQIRGFATWMKTNSLVLFVDFAKAFVVIEHDLSCKKLLLYSIADGSHKLITSLTSRKQVVCINSAKSTAMAVNYGDPEGSVIGPSFLFYLCKWSSITYPWIIRTLLWWCHYPQSHLNLYNVFKSRQVCVDKLSTWSQLNHMSLNPSKAKLMVISTRQKRQNIIANLPTLLVEKELVDIVESHKVLRVVIGIFQLFLLRKNPLK